MHAFFGAANREPTPALPSPAPSLGPRGPWSWLRAWLRVDGGARLWSIAFTLCTLWASARAFRVPNEYAKSHWLHNYHFGFVPRGLVGQIIYPVLQHKNPQEVDAILTLLAWSVFALLIGLCIWAAHQILSRQSDPWRCALMGLSLLVFASSSFFVTAGHLVGYFDQITQILGLVAVVAVHRRRFEVAGLLCTLAILVHEIFIFTVMPAVFFATLLQIRWDSAGHKAKALAYLLVPPVLVTLLIVSTGFEQSNVHKLTLEIGRYGVVRHPHMATVHLSQGFEAILKSMVKTTHVRLLRPDGLAAVGPTLCAMLGLGLSMAFGGRSWLLRLVFVLTSLTPLVMLVTVWDGDTGRFSAMAQFCTFCSLLALGLRDPQAPVPKPRGYAPVIGCALLFCVAVWNSTQRWELMDLEEDGESLLSLRQVEPPPGYRCAGLLFPNSNFEEGSLRGWQSSGTAFYMQPLGVQPALWFRRPLSEGRYWVGSYEQGMPRGRGPAVQGDEAQGSLTSLPFVIRRPKMNFLVGGGADLRHNYVALELQGTGEVLRVGGAQSTKMRVVTWDLSPWMGQSAQIRIVDNGSGPWQHINADGFCYLAAD